jgi:hypothetical protein
MSTTASINTTNPRRGTNASYYCSSINRNRSSGGGPGPGRSRPGRPGQARQPMLEGIEKLGWRHLRLVGRMRAGSQHPCRDPQARASSFLSTDFGDFFSGPRSLCGAFFMPAIWLVNPASTVAPHDPRPWAAGAGIGKHITPTFAMTPSLRGLAGGGTRRWMATR